MGLTASVSEPFFTGVGSTKDVPGKWPVALDGRGYMIDTALGQFRHETVPMVRGQGDSGDVFGEQSISPEDLWRRAQDSWHKGAGQDRLDARSSDRERFEASKGIDPWTRYQLSLLPDTSRIRSSANTNLEMVVAGSNLYLADGTSLVFTSDLSSFTDAVIHDGESATTVESITSDGDFVWAALGSNGVHRTSSGDTSSSHHNDLQATLVRYVKDRLMAAKDHEIFNITASGSAPAALLTHDDSEFTWVDFAEGTGHIYAAGFVGDKSVIYRTAVKASGTGLDTPVVAGELPDGEIVRALTGYLGFLLIGTDRGVRFATADTNGDLQIGDFIAMDSAVQAFEGQQRFVWFGWTNYDSTSTGLGRLDLTVFNENAPAYASDLMATAQGAVLSVVTFSDKRVFAVSADGVYEQSSDLVASGTVDSGDIAYDLPDEKVAYTLETVTSPLSGSYTASLAVDDGSFEQVASSSVASMTGTRHSVGQKRGRKFNLRFELSRDSGDNTSGPTLHRWTLRSTPVPSTGDFIIAPLILAETREDRLGGENWMDVAAELAHIRGLRDNRLQTKWQEGSVSYPVLVEDVTWIPNHPTHDATAWNGTVLVRMKVVT